MIKGAIFDLDGTLFDSMSIWSTIGNDYLLSLGIEPKENLAETFETFTLEESAEYYRSHYGVTLSISEIINGINDMLSDFYRNEVPLKKGVVELLEKFSQNQIKMCIATAMDKQLANEALLRLHVRDYFIQIVTTQDVGSGKTNPKIYLKALEYLKTEKQETLVFEDAYHALVTAKNEGFVVVGVHDGYESIQTEIQKISDYYITDYLTAFI
ncbi:HAD family hydrolase [Allobaculum stercoricanis]|uniref:HAD family hydrolase n=1 Tax=Allobaculum stercoricanis TaxID=174709 RepID=UPI0023F0317E|nr:HAD family phosphatase [Allobaculum stercoricanis]